MKNVFFGSLNPAPGKQRQVDLRVQGQQELHSEPQASQMIPRETPPKKKKTGVCPGKVFSASPDLDRLLPCLDTHCLLHAVLRKQMVAVSWESDSDVITKRVSWNPCACFLSGDERSCVAGCSRVPWDTGATSAWSVTEVSWRTSAERLQ